MTIRTCRRRSHSGETRNPEPRTPEQIAEDYDVSVEAVKEAIAYCESNPPELMEDYRYEQALREASG